MKIILYTLGALLLGFASLLCLCLLIFDNDDNEREQDQ